MERKSNAFINNDKGPYLVAYRLEQNGMNKRIKGAPSLNFGDIINRLKGNKERKYKDDFMNDTLENLTWIIWNSRKWSPNKKSSTEKENTSGYKNSGGICSGNKVAGLRTAKDWQIGEVEETRSSDESSLLDTLLSEDEIILNKKVRRDLTDELKKHFKPLTINNKNKKHVGLCSTSLVFFTECIGLLTHTKILQVCCNNLVRLPDEIGLVKQMRVFSASNNLIRVLPETIGYLENLVELKLSENSLTILPRSIGFLKKLKVLDLSNNKLRSLPQEIAYLTSLREFNLSNNLLSCIPAEVKRIENLENLNVDNCPLYTTTNLPKPVTPKIITLKELAARFIIKLDVPLCSPDGKDLLPIILLGYIGSANYCIFCSNPFFSAESIRYSFIKKDSTHIPVEYRMCLPHWNTEEERLVALFKLDPPSALTGLWSRPPKSLKMPPLWGACLPENKKINKKCRFFRRFS